MSTKDFSSKQEKMIASYLGWNVVSGSGCRAGRPGDVECEDWLGECKTHLTRSNKIIISLDHWRKIQEEALAIYKNPVLFVDDGSQCADSTWCFISKNQAPLRYIYLISSTRVSINKSTVSFNQDIIKRELHVAKESLTSSSVPAVNLERMGHIILPLAFFKELVV